ncbi:MAG: restriction endonuclease subunit S, partial [Anaerolineales bacterium]
MAGEWRELAIGDIAEIIGGGTPSTTDPTNFDGDIPWITPKDLSGYPFRFISRGERNISEQGLKNSSARLLPAGAVLLTTRAPVGYVAIASVP